MHPRLAVTLVALMAVALLASPTAAAAAAGKFTLYAGTNHTGSSWTVSYSTCTGQTLRPGILTVGSYDNRPLPRCQVVLQGRGGAQHVLCIGRATVPPALRNAPTIRIRIGQSATCPG